MFAAASTKAAQAAIPELRAALSATIQAYGTLKTKFNLASSQLDAAHSVIRNEFHIMSDIHQRERDELVKEMLGEGYDLSSRKFRRHRAQVLVAVKGIAGLDHVKQFQLANALYQRYDANSSLLDSQTRDAIIDGIRELLRQLRARNRGRFPTMDRITQETLLTACVAQADGHDVRTIAKLLEQGEGPLLAA